MGDFSGVADNNKKVSYRKYLWESLQTGGYNVDFVGSLTNGEFYQPSDGFDPDHEGHSGWYDHEIAAHIYNGLNNLNNGQNWLQNNPADIILLHIGTNGVDPDPSDVQDILNEIDQFEADNSVEITVIVARIIRRIDYSYLQNDNLKTTQFNDNVETLVLNRIANGDNLILVDMEDGAGMVYDVSRFGGDFWDDLHPYATGYQKMSVVWYNALTGLLPICTLEAPQITSTPITTAYTGGSYTYDVEATGNPAPTYNLTTFPAGMSINTSSGLIQWSPAATGNFPVTVEAINSVGTVSQTFTINVANPPSVNLTTNVVGGGNVSKTPNQASYLTGEAVTLTATADAGYTFAGWSGDLTGNTNPGFITIHSDKVVTGTFTATPYTVDTNTVGMGQIALTPNQATYTYNDVVTTTATADPGWVFAGWSGDLTGNINSATITIDSDKVVTATFTAIPYTVVTNIAGNGGVVKNPNQATYTYGQEVALTAVSGSGWSFAGWSGDISGTNGSETITITGDTVVTATFTQDKYSISLTTSGNGSVVSDPVKPTYTYGEAVAVTATADPGWVFTGWSGDLSGSITSQTLIMNNNKVVTATFTQSPAPSSNTTFLPLIMSGFSSSAYVSDLMIDNITITTNNE